MAVTAQESSSSELSARRLYYRQNAPTGPAAKPEVAAAETTTTQAKKTTPPATTKKTTTVASNEKSSSKPPLPVTLAGHRLSVRYNIVKVDPAGQEQPTEVAADSVFRSGDCVGIRMAPNYEGYLYVFHQGSSGKWQTLIPSDEAAEQPRRIRAFSPVQVPAGACFKFDDKPGLEKLFVVVTEKPDEAQRLNDAIRKNAPGGPEKAMPATPQSPKPLPVTYASLTTEIDRLRSQMARRDLTIEKVSQPMTSEERPHTVYVAASGNQPNQELMLEISLRHQ
jgi:hypothetical protein